MRLTPENTFAKMLRKVNDDLNDLQSQRDIDETPVQIRTVEETETSTDDTNQSVDSDPGFTWNESAWGFDPWQ